MKVLLTGFEPFGGETVNPAKEAVKLVKDEIKGAEIVKCYVPVVFGKAIETVHEAMKKENPDVVLCIGQAGGRYEITPERVAINCDDGRIPDNEGNQPVDQPVFADGETAYQEDGRIHEGSQCACCCIQHSRYLCLQPSDVWRLLLHQEGIPEGNRRLHACAVPS